MITHEKEGTYVVSFDKTVNGRMVGRMEGDDAPVFVHKESISPVLGEKWVCRLFENAGPNGINYFAILQDKVEDEASTEEAADPEEKEEPAEEFVINDMPDEDGGCSVLPKGLKIKWHRIVRYMGDDTLYSDLLDDGRYMAYASLAKTVIQLIPCRQGDFFCSDGVIRIDGIDGMLSGRAGRLLPHSEEGGVMTVFLSPV